MRVGKKYQLRRQIGSGSFGDIYLGVNVISGEEVAVKLESIKARHPQLDYEARVYKALGGGIGIPFVRWYGTERDYNALVIDLLGPSLEDLFNFCNRRFSYKTTLLLADQLVCRLEFIHSRGFIHRDIKPDNFLMGIGRRGNQVNVIDFGLAKRFRDPQTHRHIPYREHKNLTGTARYASLNTHLGVEQSRRDDLESLAYVLIYFARGGLPWQGLRAQTKRQKYTRIMECKLHTDVAQLTRGLPAEFTAFLRYARELRFDDRPDYVYFRRILRDLFVRQGYHYDYVFDWKYHAKRSRQASNRGDDKLIANDGTTQNKIEQDLPDNGQEHYYRGPGETQVGLSRQQSGAGAGAGTPATPGATPGATIATTPGHTPIPNVGANMGASMGASVGATMGGPGETPAASLATPGATPVSTTHPNLVPSGNGKVPGKSVSQLQHQQQQLQQQYQQQLHPQYSTQPQYTPAHEQQLQTSNQQPLSAGNITSRSLGVPNELVDPSSPPMVPPSLPPVSPGPGGASPETDSYGRNLGPNGIAKKEVLPHIHRSSSNAMVFLYNSQQFTADKELTLTPMRLPANVHDKMAFENNLPVPSAVEFIVSNPNLLESKVYRIAFYQILYLRTLVFHNNGPLDRFMFFRANIERAAQISLLLPVDLPSRFDQYELSFLNSSEPHRQQKLIDLVWNRERFLCGAISLETYSTKLASIGWTDSPITEEDISQAKSAVSSTNIKPSNEQGATLQYDNVRAPIPGAAMPGNSVPEQSSMPDTPLQAHPNALNQSRPASQSPSAALGIPQSRLNHTQQLPQVTQQQFASRLPAQHYQQQDFSGNSYEKLTTPSRPVYEQGQEQQQPSDEYGNKASSRNLPENSDALNGNSGAQWW